jgi:DNA-binding transcriptional ArsR family regulator
MMGVLAIGQSKASRHLAYLRNAGLVDDRRAGAWMYYLLSNPSWSLLCARLGCLSADFHIHFVLLAIIAERNGLVGALRAIADYARYSLAPVVAYADVVERFAVAVVDLE